MKCDWCKEDSIQEDTSSLRCANCGGAHWTCSTPECGRVVSESRPFCSACGAERVYPLLNGLKKPVVSLFRVPGIPIKADVGGAGGFHARRAEGFCHNGRLILAGTQHVFVGPNPKPKELGEEPALGLVCKAKSEDEEFGLPSGLPGNGMVVGSRQRLLAIALHTGETIAVGSDSGSCIKPVVCAMRDETSGKIVAGKSAVWIAKQQGTHAPGMTLIRYAYEPGECLKLGTFAKVSELQGDRNIRAGTMDGDSDGETAPGIWFVAGAHGKPAFAYRINPADDALEECSNWSACAVPRSAPERTMLWRQGREGEWFWISRGGWDDDGAFPVQKVMSNNAKQIEYEAFQDSLLERTRVVKLSDVRETDMSQRPVDGLWVRTDKLLRWGWCDDEAPRLASDPGPRGWTDEALLKDLKTKPLPEQIGPLIPTRWGFATVVGERPDFLNLMYFDFPKMG